MFLLTQENSFSMSKLPECLLDQCPESLQTRFHVAAEMHTKRAPSALRQYLKIAARLRCLYHAKRVFMSRHRQFHRIVTGDLQKHSGVRVAFVGLSGGVQKARPKAEASRNMVPVADRVPNRHQALFVDVIDLDESQDRTAITRSESAQMSFQISCQRPVGTHSCRQPCSIFFVREKLDPLFLTHRLFRGQGAGLFELRCQSLRCNLAGFDIGLIECVDADDGTGDGSGNLPAEKFRS